MRGFSQKAVSATASWSVDSFAALLCDLYHELAGFQKLVASGKPEDAAGLPTALEAALTLRARKVSLAGS